MSLFIAIAGNMGVGKSELTTRLAARLGWRAFIEPAAQNPYLPDFYKEMDRWAFHSQVFFLAHRLREHHELSKLQCGVIQDRSVYENAEIFARNLFERGFMSARDWETYRTLYDTLVSLLPPPSLIIYLQSSVDTLIKRIETRGRTYEQKIDVQYLQDLNRLYQKWAETTTVAPILKIPTDHINFLNDERALQKLVKQIIATLPSQQLPLF